MFLKQKDLICLPEHKRKIEVNTLVLPTLAEFIVLLWKSLNDIRVFVDDIWKKVCNLSRYPLENIMNWSAYIKYL